MQIFKKIFLFVYKFFLKIFSFFKSFQNSSKNQLKNPQFIYLPVSKHLPKNCLNKLRSKSKITTTQKQRKLPKETDLIFIKLPIEIIWFIAEYLSPMEAMRFAMCSKYIMQLIQDEELWRRISISFNELFEWKTLQIQSCFGNANIGMKNQLQLKNKNGILYSNSLNFSYFPKSLNQHSRKKMRICYIRTLDHPRKEMVTRIKRLDQMVRLQKKETERIEAKRMKQLESDKILGKLDQFMSNYYPKIFLLGVLGFLINLTLYHENILPIKFRCAMFVLFPIFFAICVFIAFTFIFPLMTSSNSNLIPFGFLNTWNFLLLIFVLLIGLKVDSIIHPSSWIVVFIPAFLSIAPFVIFFIFLPIVLRLSGTTQNNSSNFSFFYSVVVLFLNFAFFLFILAKKLDGKITNSYFVVFIPLFFQNNVTLVIPFIICMVNKIFSRSYRSVSHFFSYHNAFEAPRFYLIFFETLFVLMIPVSVFEFLLAMYLENMLIHFYPIMIPLFLLVGLAFSNRWIRSIWEKIVY
ncbi:fam11a b protein [Anaeramoeba ignava]|uniref:Fam11a b protein n=1 Tax=Anaeramoeba ignava TaxID=1746090 RepID=A0A9Q0R4H9_ANAIG|nr:fam11a b protein [Anaeramoeba ignava]